MAAELTCMLGRRPGAEVKGLAGDQQLLLQVRRERRAQHFESGTLPSGQRTAS